VNCLKKKVLATVLIVVLMFSMCSPAFAATPYAASFTPSLTFSGVTANCSVTINDFGKYIDADLELWDGNTIVDSWSGSGTSVVRITGSCNVASGRTYTLKVTGTIGGSTISMTPVSRTCP